MLLSPRAAWKFICSNILHAVGDCAQSQNKQSCLLVALKVSVLLKNSKHAGQEGGKVKQSPQPQRAHRTLQGQKAPTPNFEDAFNLLNIQKIIAVLFDAAAGIVPLCWERQS